MSLDTYWKEVRDTAEKPNPKTQTPTGKTGLRRTQLTGVTNHTDYRETAVKFQKEWQVKEPHRDLPFARHVSGHALVSVLNRGLLYYGFEREAARNQVCP